MSMAYMLKSGSLAALAAAMSLTAMPAEAQNRPAWNDVNPQRQPAGRGDARVSRRGNDAGIAPARREVRQQERREVRQEARQEARRIDRSSERRAERIEQRGDWAAARAAERGNDRQAQRIEHASEAAAAQIERGGDRRAAQVLRQARRDARGVEWRGTDDANRSWNRDRDQRDRNDGRGDWRDQRDRNDRGNWRDQRDRSDARGNRGSWRTDRDWRDQRDHGNWRDQRGRSDWRGDRGHNASRGDYRRWDDRSWRGDRRYDWNRYRNNNRRLYNLGRYYAPYRNYSYRRVSIGFSLGSVFFGSRYQIDDPYHYRLPVAYGPYRWVRYYDDVLLVDTYSGEVVDVIYNFFW